MLGRAVRADPHRGAGGHVKKAPQSGARGQKGRMNMAQREKESSSSEASLLRKVQRLEIRLLILSISIMLLVVGGIKLYFIIQEIVDSLVFLTESLDLISQKVDTIRQIVQSFV